MSVPGGIERLEQYNSDCTIRTMLNVSYSVSTILAVHSRCRHMGPKPWRSLAIQKVEMLSNINMRPIKTAETTARKTDSYGKGSWLKWPSGP
jgi:hypothetical protein